MILGQKLDKSEIVALMRGGVLPRLVDSVAVNAPIPAVLAGEQHADEGGLAHAFIQSVRDPGARIGHERRRRDRIYVGAARGARELCPLVIPAIDVLHETRALLHLTGRQVLDHPCVVEPHVHARHAHVEQVIQVLAARDVRVEGHAPEGPGMHGEATAAHVIRPRDARARKGALHPPVELDALGPPPAGDAVLLGGIREGRTGLVVKVTALGKNGQPLACLMTQAVHGLLHEIGGEDHLVVVQEDHGVVPEDGGEGEPHVPDGAVAAQRDGLAAHVGRDRAHALHDRRRLVVGDERHVERGVLVDQGPHVPRDTVGLPLRAHQQHDDARYVANLLEGGEAPAKLGMGLGGSDEWSYAPGDRSSAESPAQ